MIDDSHRGKVLIGGSFLTISTFEHAKKMGVSGIVSGGFDYNDLSKISALAGGLVCEKVGVVPIDKETLLEETKKTYK